MADHGHQANNPDGAHDDDHEPSFRDYLISLRTMDVRQRALTGVVFAQIVVATITLVLRNAPEPSVQIDLGAATISLSAINYALSIVSLTGALALAAIGMAYARLSGRLLLLAALAALYLVVIFGLFGGDREEKVGALATFFSIPFTIVIGMAIPAIYRRRYSPERRSPIVYRSMQVIWLGFAALGLLVYVETCLHPDQFADLLVLIRIPLPYLFLLAGTDWAEIDDSIVRAAFGGRAAGRLRVLTWVNVLASLLLMGMVSAYAGWGVWRSLPLGLALAALLYLTLRAARAGGSWPIRFPWAALAVLVITFSAGLDIVGANWLASLSLDAVIVTAAATALALCRRRGVLRWLTPVLLYAVVLGLSLVFMLLPGAVTGGGPAGLLFCIGAAGLAAVAWLRRRGRAAEAQSEPLRLLLLLNLSVLALFCLYAFAYHWLQEAGGRADALFAAVIFAALLWDVAVSGHSITNIDGGLFPRRSRIFLFFAYVTLVVATVEFFGSLTVVAGDQSFQEAVKILGDPEGFVQRGIAVYGPAMLLTLFLLRLGRWRAGLASSGPAGGTA